MHERPNLPRGGCLSFSSARIKQASKQVTGESGFGSSQHVPFPASCILLASQPASQPASHPRIESHRAMPCRAVSTVVGGNERRGAQSNQSEGNMKYETGKLVFMTGAILPTAKARSRQDLRAPTPLESTCCKTFPATLRGKARNMHV
jgi:hypothetical protein